MKHLVMILMISFLTVPGLLLAETAEVIPWDLNPDEGIKEQDDETSESAEDDEDTKDTAKEKKAEADESDESEEEYDLEIKINKDYPNSVFYPGPNRRNEPSFGIPDR